MQFALAFRVATAPLSAKLLKTFRNDAGWAEETAIDVRRPFNPASRVVWVTAEASGKTVGIARLELAAPQFCYVSELIVLRSHRGHGIGEWMVKHIEQYCLGQGIPRMLLQPRDSAKGFYEKLHFIPDGHVAGFLKKEINPFQRKLAPFPLLATGK